MRDLLESAIREVLVVDPANDRRLGLVDDGERVLPARGIGLPVQLVAVADAAGDLPVAHARAERLARARSDRFKLHLMAGPLDEGGGLVDRVRELHLLAGDVVVEPAPAIADEIADDKRHLDRVATEARLI